MSETNNHSAVLAFNNRIVDAVERETVKFGQRQEIYPVGTNEQGQLVLATIDAFMFSSPTNLRLKKMKTVLKALKDEGVKQSDGTEINSVWFNANVRDPFHKILRYAAKHSLEHGEPVSLAFTRRTIKSGVQAGKQIVTAKHAFEHVVTPPTPKAIAATAAAKADKPKTPAKKAPKAPRITPLNAVKASPDNTAVLNQIADNIAAQVGAEITKATLGAAA